MVIPAHTTLPIQDTPLYNNYNYNRIMLYMENNITDRHTDRHTEWLLELLVGAKKVVWWVGQPITDISQGPLLTF